MCLVVHDFIKRCFLVIEVDVPNLFHTGGDPFTLRASNSAREVYSGAERVSLELDVVVRGALGEAAISKKI